MKYLVNKKWMETSSQNDSIASYLISRTLIYIKMLSTRPIRLMGNSDLCITSVPQFESYMTIGYSLTWGLCKGTEVLQEPVHQGGLSGHQSQFHTHPQSHATGYLYVQYAPLCLPTVGMQRLREWGLEAPELGVQPPQHIMQLTFHRLF